MANVNKSGFSYAYRETSGPEPVREFWTTSNVTLAKGDSVILSSTGYANIGSSSTSQLVGVAKHAVTGSTGVRQKVLVTLGLPDVVFVGQTSGIMAQSYVGDLCDIEGATSVQEVNENAATQKQLRIVEIRAGESLDSNCKVYFKMNKCPFSGAASSNAAS